MPSGLAAYNGLLIHCAPPDGSGPAQRTASGMQILRTKSENDANNLAGAAHLFKGRFTLRLPGTRPGSGPTSKLLVVAAKYLFREQEVCPAIPKSFQKFVGLLFFPARPHTLRLAPYPMQRMLYRHRPLAPAGSAPGPRIARVPGRPRHGLQALQGRTCAGRRSLQNPPITK